MSDEPKMQPKIMEVDLAALRLLMQNMPDPVEEQQRIYETLHGLLLSDPEFVHLVRAAEQVARVDRGTQRLPQEDIILIALGVYVVRQYHRGEAL